MSAPDRMRAAIAGPSSHREGCNCPLHATSASDSLPAVAFHFEAHAVRTVIVDGEPWFVASDVATVLGYRMAADMTRRLDDCDKGYAKVRTPGGIQTLNTINESGLYDSVFRSNSETAKPFRRWVTATVLPQIRRTGSYVEPTAAPPAPAELPDRSELARWVIEAEDKAKREKAARIAAEHRTRELEAPAAAWSTLENAVGDYAVADAAKVLSRDPSISIGRDRLFRFMAFEGWIFRDKAAKCWKAKQAQVTTGRLVEKVGRPFLDRETSEMRVPNPTVRVTAKGLKELHRLLRGSETLPTMAAVTE